MVVQFPHDLFLGPRFDFPDFAAFDIHILKRPDAADGFPVEIVAEAEKRFSEMSDERKSELSKNVVFGLPGAAENFSLDDVRQHLAEYDGMSGDTLRQHLIDFLSEVIPTAEELGIRMCCHPDDPPYPLLGLPRVMSTEKDYRTVITEIDSPANGITLCSGSLGARPDNDIPGMMERLGDRVHFLHLRNVKRETANIMGSFHEAEHLGGDTDMVALLAAVVREEKKRREAGRADHSIPFRPDHGQDILDDLGALGTLRHGRFERIEIDHHQIDRADGMLLHRGDMIVLVAQGEQPAVHLGMQRLDPAIHHLRELSHVGNVFHRDARFRDRLLRATRGEQLHTHFAQLFRSLNKARLIGNGNQRTLNGKIGHGEPLTVWESVGGCLSAF